MCSGVLMLVPGIAGDVPADRRLVLQRIEIFRLAGQQVEHLDALEQAALAGPRARTWRGRGRTARRRSRRAWRRPAPAPPRRASILPSGGACSATNSTSGCFSFSSFLKAAVADCAVLVVRIDDRPALLLELGGVGNQHRRLHVGRGAQAEGVGVAGVPDDLVGQRLGGDEQHLALLGEVGDGEADVRREGADQEGDLLAAQQLLGDAHGVGRDCRCRRGSRPRSCVPSTPPAALTSSTASSSPSCRARGRPGRPCSC